MIEMSLNRKKELSLIAKEFCRNLRANQTDSEAAFGKLLGIENY